MINRAAMIVRPKKPFMDWAAGLDDSGLVPTTDDDQTVYLIPDYSFPEDLDAIVEQVYRYVFEYELHSWHTDEADWPTIRDLETFHAWFKVEAHSIVEDLCGGEFVDDDDDDGDGDDEGDEGDPADR